MSPRPSCRDGSSSKLPMPFSPALRLRPLSKRWSKWAERPEPAFAWVNGTPCCCCCCCCWGCCWVDVVLKREDWPRPRPLVCCVLFVVDCDAVLLNSEKPPVCGCDCCCCCCDVDAAPENSEGVVVAVDFAAPRPPNRLPPRPPLLVACVVPDCAFGVPPPPRLPNKLGVVPLDAPPAVPNNPPLEVPLEAGCEPPRLPNSDIVGALSRVVMVPKTNLEKRDRVVQRGSSDIFIPVTQVPRQGEPAGAISCLPCSRQDPDPVEFLLSQETARLHTIDCMLKSWKQLCIPEGTAPCTNIYTHDHAATIKRSIFTIRGSKREIV